MWPPRFEGHSKRKALAFDLESVAVVRFRRLGSSNECVQAKCCFPRTHSGFFFLFETHVAQDFRHRADRTEFDDQRLNELHVGGKLARRHSSEL